MPTDIISPILAWLIEVVIYKNRNGTLEIILNIIGYTIVLFFSLVYNEIIICNCFGLNRKTKKYLERKQREEFSSIIDNDNDDDNDNNENNNEVIELKNGMD